MSKDKPIKQKIEEIISTVDSMDKNELETQFIRLNSNARNDFQSIFQEASKSNDFEQQYNLIAPNIDKFLLKKTKPITSMLPYFKGLSTDIRDFETDLKNGKIGIAEILIFTKILKSAIKTLTMGIEKKDNAIITVDYNNSKDSLKNEFEKMLANELPQSPIYNKRKKVRNQGEETLRNYLKVWLLEDLGLEFEDIALRLYSKEANKRGKMAKHKISTVRKQWSSAYELIFGSKYNKDEHRQYQLKYSSQKLCPNCPERKGCKKPCERLLADLKQVEG